MNVLFKTISFFVLLSLLISCGDCKDCKKIAEDGRYIGEHQLCGDELEKADQDSSGWLCE